MSAEPINPAPPVTIIVLAIFITHELNKISNDFSNYHASPKFNSIFLHSSFEF